MFYSLNGGQSWQRLNNNMPTVAVHDVIIHPRDGDLIAATHGRGIWIMDDITPLQQMTPPVQQSEAHLFQNRPAIQWLSIQPQHGGGNLAFQGQNPTRNAVINYYLSDKVTGDVRFEITDVDGHEHVLGVRSRRDAPGISRVEWAMRWTSGPGAAPAGGGGGGRGGGGGGGAAGAARAVVLARLSRRRGRRGGRSAGVGAESRPRALRRVSFQSPQSRRLQADAVAAVVGVVVDAAAGAARNGPNPARTA